MATLEGLRNRSSSKVSINADDTRVLKRKSICVRIEAMRIFYLGNDIIVVREVCAASRAHVDPRSRKVHLEELAHLSEPSDSEKRYAK